MQYFWINQNNNKKLILFMNGWAMNESAVNHLNKEDFDILMINDYREINYDLLKIDFSKYEKKYLIAWSMGVYVSNLFADFLNTFDKKTALSGTNKIIDDNFGIPLKIYNYTIKHFSNESKDKFLKNIFLEEKKDITINKTTKELQDELISIKNLKIKDLTKFDKAIVAKKDIIVPYKNQFNFWNNKNIEIEEINAPHYVFNGFKSWGELC